jgi:hypothetical protein
MESNYLSFLQRKVPISPFEEETMKTSWKLVEGDTKEAKNGDVHWKTFQEANSAMWQSLNKIEDHW